MRPPAGKCNETVNSCVKFLHLLDRSSICFWVFDEAVHLDYELRRRQDGLL
jgi:hypothetical protein